MVVFSECSRPIVSDLKQSEFVSDSYKPLSSQVRFLAMFMCQVFKKKFVLGLLLMVRFNNRYYGSIHISQWDIIKIFVFSLKMILYFSPLMKINAI